MCVRQWLHLLCVKELGENVAAGGLAAGSEAVVRESSLLRAHNLQHLHDLRISFGTLSPLLGGGLDALAVLLHEVK